MTALVVCETLLLVVLTFLVAGLLRSHAEILRRIGPPDDEDGDEDALRLRRHAPARREHELAAADVAGATLGGDSAKVSLAPGSPPTLLAFLTSGCTSCHAFWEAFGSPRRAELPAGTRLVAITKDGSHESPARLRELRPGDVPVVMSTSAWQEYRVPAAPYFAYVEGGHVAGEGAATGWEQLASLMRDHPSRAIVIRIVDEPKPELEARVLAQCWMPQGQRRQICCEQIEISSSNVSQDRSRWSRNNSANR